MIKTRDKTKTLRSVFRAIVSLLILYVTEACSHADLYNVVSFEGGVNVTIERGAINKDGSNNATMECYCKWIRSAFFIEIHGAKSVSIPTNRAKQCYVWQYDDDYNVISYNEMINDITLSMECKFIRFHIKASNTPNSVSIYLDESNEKLRESKLLQTNFPFERLIYAVDSTIYTTALLMLPSNYSVSGDAVPLIIWDSGDGSFMDWDNHEMGDGVEGRINGLNYLKDNGFAVLEIYSWGSHYYKKYPGCGIRSAMPIPTHLATHEKGVEYVLSRYNIDKDNIFHISKSGSGKIALYYAMVKPSFNLKSIYSFAPVFDDLNFVGWKSKGYRQALFEELDLKGTDAEIVDFIDGSPYDYDIAYKKENNLDIELIRSWQMHKPLGRSFIEKNADKFCRVSVDWMNVSGQTLQEKADATHKYSEMFWDGYNRQYNAEEESFYFAWDNASLPASHSDSYARYDLERVGNDIPFTVIMSPTDEQTPYWNALEVVRQFQNTGKDARMITLETGGHGGPELSMNGVNSRKNITTRLGVHYDVVSIGWYIAVEDIYERFITHLDPSKTK